MVLFAKLNKQFPIYLSVFLSLAVGSAQLSFANPDESQDLLEVEAQKDFSEKFAVDETAILNEEHVLLDLLRSNPEENLAALHPSIVMNAPQRIASWINYGGESTIPDPEHGNGNVKFYKVFSGGIPEAGGKLINGQFDAIQSFVDYVFAAARGDGSASKMLLFVGPSGTGKTHFLSILQSLAQTLTATSPDYFVYTYEWKDLRKFKALRPALNIQGEGTDDEFEHPFPCPINESPLNLIPDSLATKVVKMVTDKVMKLSKAKPTPRRYHCPHCQVIRQTILKDYMATNKLRRLTPKQEVDALSPFVTIKRIVIGNNGTMARLDAEPKDVDYQGLLMSPNAFVFQSFGPKHPLAYFIGGKIPQSNGSVFLPDEFFRGDEGYRDTLLNVIEEHRVRKGGAPELELDTVVIGASNYESIEKAIASGNAIAHLDRTYRVRMPYLLNPILEAKNLLMMKNPKTVLMQELGSTFASHSSDDSSSMLISKPTLSTPLSPVPADLDLLFPLPKSGEAMAGPDHRYKLWFEIGPSVSPVHLSPHTLMYIAMTVTGSRLVTDPQLALKFGEKGVIKDAAYRDVFTRLQILMRQYTSINASDLNDLRSLSNDLNEGDFGITERDAANVWLTKAIAEAQRPENGNCLTPDLARKVFLQLLEKKAIRYPDLKTRVRWTNISDDIMTKYLIPSVRNDVNTALGAGLGAVNSIYDEIFQEILALSMDSKAKTYNASNGETREINQKRLDEIQEIYKTTEHRDFAYGEVTAHALTARSGENKRHLGLLRSVKSYLAKRATELVTFDDIQRFSETHDGSSEVRQRATEISHVLSHELGYCDRCMKSALMLSRQATSRVEQVHH